MTRLFLKLFIVATIIMSCCNNVHSQTKLDFKKESEAFYAHVRDYMTKYNEAGINRDSLIRVQQEYMYNITHAHIGDSLGLMITQMQVPNMDKHELDSVMGLCELYKNDEKIKHYRQLCDKNENTSVDRLYIDIIGIDAATGKSLKLSDFLNQGKPVLVDFWASWCSPCRNEIKKYLSAFYQKYRDKVNFVSIAVWENDVTDTQKAMKELSMSWPVMYAGGRENSPTDKYGITGIPHIIFIDSDGKIKERDIRGEEIEKAILKTWNK